MFLIFPNIHWKATLLESLLNKVADLQPKETATQVLSYEYNEIFKNSFLCMYYVFGLLCMYYVFGMYYAAGYVFFITNLRIH